MMKMNLANPRSRAPIIGQVCIDLLQAAWQLEDAEFELLLQVRPRWLAAWRIHEVDAMEAELVAHDPLARLIQLHEALRLAARPGQYGEYIRRRWRADSPIGARSILEAILADGDAAMNLVERYLWAKAAGN